MHKTSENNFNIVLLKVILSCEPHYFPVDVSFPGVLPNDRHRRVVGVGFFSTNRVAGVFLVKGVYWLPWSLWKCWCEAFRRPWRRNGHTVLSIPSSRCIWSGVRLLVVLSCHAGCFREGTGPLFIENALWLLLELITKGRLLVKFSVMYLSGNSQRDVRI